MKISTHFVMRTVGAENIVLPCNGSLNAMIKLNESASLLWHFFQAEHTRQEAISYLSTIYEADSSTLENGVDAFIAVLRQNQLLE